MTLDHFQAAYIPPGSIVLEETLAGSINYGIRVPLLPLTKFSGEDYGSYIEACKADELPGGKHRADVLTYVKEVAANGVEA